MQRVFKRALHASAPARGWNQLAVAGVGIPITTRMYRALKDTTKTAPFEHAVPREAYGVGPVDIVLPAARPWVLDPRSRRQEDGHVLFCSGGVLFETGAMLANHILGPKADLSWITYVRVPDATQRQLDKLWAMLATIGIKADDHAHKHWKVAPTDAQQRRMICGVTSTPYEEWCSECVRADTTLEQLVGLYVQGIQ
jgi:hypothetical protein